MKNNKTVKISLLILSLALCFSVIFAMNANAEDATTEPTLKPEIISQNVAYTGDFSLVYAVDAATATGPVTLSLYNEEPTADTKPIKTYVATTVTASYGNLSKDAYIFTTEGVVAAAMTQNFYVQAVDANGAKSEVKRYSVAEYLYERLASNDATEKQKNLYNSVIDFGKSAQKVVNNETDATKYITNYRYVTVKDGTINGYKSGVYPIGTVLTPVADGASKWSVVAYDANGKPTLTKTTSTFTVVDAVKTEVAAGDIVIYREGVNNFEQYKEGDSFPFWAANNGEEALVFEEGHGMVAKVELPATNDQLILYKNNSDVAKEDATAFEFSFDFKMVTPGGIGVKTEYIELNAQVGSSNIHRNAVYDGFKGSDSILGKEVSTNGLAVVNPSNGAWNGPGTYNMYDNIDPTGWIHVRVVYYDGDKNCYVYINGSDEPFVNTKMNLSTYDGNIENISQCQMLARVDGAGTVIYVDNLFIGYTMDANPHVGTSAAE